MTLPAPGASPPTTTPLAYDAAAPPCPPLPSGLAPSAAVPIRFPRTATDGTFAVTPLPAFPEIRFPDPGAAPPMVPLVCVVNTTPASIPDRPLGTAASPAALVP